MADLPCGGAADNVAATDHWTITTVLEASPPTDGVEPMRFMFGDVGIYRFRLFVNGKYFRDIPVVVGDDDSSLPDQPDSSPPPHRLADQIRRDGD